jgi:hypothetical protein
MANVVKSATSTKLRIAAMTAVVSFKRPITAHELEKWLSVNDPDLWSEVSEKCYDYVRIILALSPDDSLIKYKCLSIVPGADRRACFYGSADDLYDPSLWTPLRKGRRRSPNQFEKPIPPPVATYSPPDSLFFPNRVIMPFKANVTNAECEQAWFALTTLVPSREPFWDEFQTAAHAMKRKIERGMQPDAVIRQLLLENPALTHPLVAADAVQILSREAALKVKSSSGPSDDNEPEGIVDLT